MRWQRGEGGRTEAAASWANADALAAILRSGATASLVKEVDRCQEQPQKSLDFVALPAKRSALLTAGNVARPSSSTRSYPWLKSATSLAEIVQDNEFGLRAPRRMPCLTLLSSSR